MRVTPAGLDLRNCKGHCPEQCLATVCFSFSSSHVSTGTMAAQGATPGLVLRTHTCSHFKCPVCMHPAWWGACTLTAGDRPLHESLSLRLHLQLHCMLHLIIAPSGDSPPLQRATTLAKDSSRLATTERGGGGAGGGRGQGGAHLCKPTTPLPLVCSCSHMNLCRHHLRLIEPSG